MNIALALTLLRIVSIPLFVMCFYLASPGGYLLTLMIFVLAALTDWLDGYLARSLRQTSRFGAFLDPVADKLLVITALVLIVGESKLPLIAIPVVVIVCREIIISAMREWMGTLGELSEGIAVSWGGKLKTTVQMVAIIILLIGRQQFLIAWVGYICLYVAAGLSVLTLIHYGIVALRSCRAMQKSL